MNYTIKDKFTDLILRQMIKKPLILDSCNHYTSLISWHLLIQIYRFWMEGLKNFLKMG